MVTADIDPAAVEDLITACVQYHRIRAQASAGHTQGGEQSDPDQQAPGTAETLAMLEHQILATILQVVSGPGGVASFLRRNLLGKG